MWLTVLVGFHYFAGDETNNLFNQYGSQKPKHISCRQCILVVIAVRNQKVKDTLYTSIRPCVFAPHGGTYTSTVGSVLRTISAGDYVSLYLYNATGADLVSYGTTGTVNFWGTRIK